MTVSPAAVQATPHVAGLAALLAAEIGHGRPQLLKQRIMQSADDLGQTGVDPYYGAGLYFVKGWLEWDQGRSDAAQMHLEKFAALYTLDREKTPIYNAAFEKTYSTFLEFASARPDSARGLLLEVRKSLDSIETKDVNLLTLVGILEAEALLARHSPEAAIRVYRATPVVGPNMHGCWLVHANVQYAVVEGSCPTRISSYG